MKKYVFVLFIVIIVSLCCVSVFADTPTQEVIDDLQKYNIIEKEEDLRFEDNVTRAEAIKMICLADNDPISDNEVASIQRFTDVPTTHWAATYIDTGCFTHVIDGYEDGTFRPENNVTYQEMQKMIVSVLGYNIFAVDEGGYPDGYLHYAEKLGIKKKLTIDDNTACITRGDAMQMIYNALDVPIVVTQRRFYGDVEGEPLIIVFDGTGKYELRTLRMFLDGEVY